MLARQQERRNVLAVTAAAAPRPQAAIEPLVDLTRARMGDVNAVILSKTGSDVTMIPEVANHLISSGGKRIRPMLTLAMADLSGYRGDGHVVLAAAVEFMHTATLLHDDVVDESDMRRGKLAARKLWGNEASVLVGDFLLGQAFKMMVDVGSLDCLRVLADAAAVIAEGEVMQLSAARRTATTEAQYFSVIKAKTAALFSAAAEVGPLLAGRDDLAAPARRYGEAIGIAFQLVDDALDYGGEGAAMGKNTGDDFREGKMTLPVIHALSKADAPERAFWQAAFEGGARGEAELKEAMRLIARHGSVGETLRRARGCIADAHAALTAFPTGVMTSALKDAAAFVVDRAS